MTKGELDEVRACLRSAFRSGRALLFTGAGFSSAARDRSGRPLPSTSELTDALWDLCFPGEARDASQLQDLFEHARRTRDKELDALVRERLLVDPSSLPEHYRAYFAAPWKRAYTLNVDDIELAAAKRFRLPRSIRVVSALGEGGLPRAESPLAGDAAAEGALEFVHLNGTVLLGPAHVTFSTTQYGARLAQEDACYKQMTEDLVGNTFVFVGTTLNEAPLWQHVEGREARGEAKASGCPSFIVTPELDRARVSLLGAYDIAWIPMTSADFAREVLAPALEG